MPERARTNLTEPGSSFVGRAKELGALHNAFEQSRLVTLLGRILRALVQARLHSPGEPLAIANIGLVVGGEIPAVTRTLLDVCL